MPNFSHTSQLPKRRDGFSVRYVFSPNDMIQYCWFIGQGQTARRASIPTTIQPAIVRP